MTQKKAKTFLSFTDAAEQIIRTEGKSVSYSKIAEIALARKYIQSEAADPALSVYVSLRTEIKKRSERNEPQRFIFLGNGLFSLKDFTEKVKSALDQVRDSRRQACQKLYEALTKDDRGSEFEKMVSDLLLAMGYQNVNVIGGNDDQGVDITCERREGLMIERFAIQCKCKSLKKQIGPKDISTLRDNLSTYQCQKGILITTTKLNQEAKNKAKESGKELINYIEYDEIFDLFADFGIGIKSETIKYFALEPNQYEFLK